MPVIRIPRNEWGKVWRFLVKTSPISRLSQETVYQVSDQQVELLRKQELPFTYDRGPAVAQAWAAHWSLQDGEAADG